MFVTHQQPQMAFLLAYPTYFSNQPTYIHLENNEDFYTNIQEVRVYSPSRIKDNWEILISAKTEVHDGKTQNGVSQILRTYPNWVISRLEIIPHHNNLFEVICYVDYDAVKFQVHLEKLGASIKMAFPHESNSKHVATINYKTRLRAETFKQLKEDNPHWTQEKVALEASDILRESLTANAVRNAYRAMGWKWPRGDRTR